MLLQFQITVFHLKYFQVASSAVNRLIAINRIQTKSFLFIFILLHNMCVYCVYLLCINKYTHMHAYI